MAGLYSKFKSAIGLGPDSSQTQTDGTSVNDQPLALEASKVSANFMKDARVGSLGTVYTGRFMEEKCAVKVYNSGVVHKDALQKHEIASIIQHHPNVVLIHGLWYGSPANTLPNNDPALVMEYCSMSLNEYLEETVAKGDVAVFRLVKKREILSGVASGMAYLHSREIVHGGLSARKVLLNFTGPSNDQAILAKVAGLHEMKLFSEDKVMQLMTSDQRRRIMPPEVKGGGRDGELTKPVDLFSFGCLIVHVVSCVNPVPSMEAGLNEFQKRCQSILKSPLEPLMKRCLDENPVARGTFEDVEKDLSAHQSNYGGKQAQKLGEQTQEVNARREAGTFESAVDQPEVHNTSTAETSGSPEPAAEVSSPNFLPSESVIITAKKQNKVAEGPFAKVYRGEYARKPCAVKVYKEDVLKKKLACGPTDKHHIALTAVKHTNIVQMYGIWYHHHKAKVLPSIVMELCQETLLEAIKKWNKRTTHKHKLLIKRDITAGMVYLHDQCIIHGNLHSGNVLLCHDGGKTVAKVSDFDMIYRDLSTQSRLTNRFTADEHFLPPEVFDCKKAKEKWAMFTCKVDVFCFGELALEMAHGSYPTPDRKVKGHLTLTELQRRQKYLTKLEKSDGEKLDSIIQKCFSDTPEGRPSFTDILSDMDKHLQKYGERPDCAMLQKGAVESEAFSGQALGKADSKSLSDMQERKKDLKSGSPQQVIYDTSVDLPPLVPETSSLDTGVLSKATPDPFPLSLESSLVTYDDTKVIGQGSFATVYRGMYKEQKCGIKVFKKGMVRFLKGSEGESQLASIVRHHPNVVLVHGLLHRANQFPDDQPALVMELCNTTLQAYLQGKIDKGEDESFETAIKLVVLRDIAAGMIYLHSEQIVHGDLAANNVLLNVTESKVVAKVAGFGQSRLLNTQTVITNSARREIMPPEASGSQNQLPTKAVDVFSFGCLILHVSSCFYPDLGTDCQVGTSEFQKRAEKYISESEKHVFRPWMMRCLEKHPEARWTFEEVMAHLNKYSKREQAQIVEEGNREIEKLRSQLLQLQRAYDNQKEELAAEKETCSEAQKRRDTLEKELQHMEQKLNDVVADNEQHRSLAVEGIFRNYAAPKDEMKKLEDQVQKQDSDMKLLHQQHAESVMKCDKYCRENNDLQNEVKRLSSELETLQREKGGIVGEKNVIEELKQKADKNVTELQKQLQACQQKCEKTEGELRDCSDRVRLLTTDVLTKSNMVSQLEKDVASRDSQLGHARAFKERANKERETATLERDQAKKETEKLKEEFEKKRQTLQAEIARHEKTNNTLQETLSGARKTGQTLNDELRQYRDKLKTTEGARDKFERSKVALEEEVAARDKKVRELTTELTLRNGDLDKKEKELFTTKKDLVDALAAVEEGKSLEPKLRQTIVELEDEKRELTDDLEKTGGKLKNVQKKLTEAMDSQNALEREREQQDETIRELEGVCDRLSDSVQTLESKLSEKEACCEELEQKRYEEAQNCQLMETERDHARKEADEVRRESKELYKEHDSLRVAHTKAQQKKKELSKQVMEYEQQMKVERAATAKERDSLSLELVALRQEKRRLEEDLEVKHQDLMSKREELNVAESCVLGLQQRIEDLQEEYKMLQSDRQEIVHKFNELAPRCEEVERQHAEEAEKCRFWKGECDRFAIKVGHLERTRCQMEAHTQELEKQQVEEAEKCHCLEDEKASALKKADNLQEQCDTLYRDNETLRKTLQNKTKIILELRQSQEEIKAKLAATEKEHESTSLKLVALRQEKGRVEEYFEATSQDLKSKHEELMVSVSKCNKLESSQEKLECLFTEMAAMNEALQEQLDEATEKCHAMESECKRFTSSVEELETELNKVKAHSEEFRQQLDGKLEMCRLMERGRAIEFQRAEELQKQRDEMYRDHESLRKKLNADLQKKMDLIQELKKSEQQMKTARDCARNRAGDLEKQLADLHMDHEKLRGVQLSELQGRTNLIEELMESERQNEADLISADRDYEALKAKLEATAEDASKAKTSLVQVSSELEAKKRDLENTKKQLEDARECLKEKVEECKAFESTQLQLLPNMDDLKREKQQLDIQVMQKEVELTKLEAERSALRGQLRDFAVIKAENESLKNGAEEQAERSRRLAKLEEHLNKERIDLTIERRLVMEQKKKINTDSARSRNLESIVKRSVQESFELLNASGREMSESGGSEDLPDSTLPESPISRGDMNSGTIVEGKWEVEEALRQEKHQLDRARQEIKQLKIHMQDAERKLQDSSEEMHKLAQTYFQSHRYPPFLYQLHQLQKHLPSSGVQGISTLGDGRTVEVTMVTDLRSFMPNESWCDEFQSLIVKLKAMPSKQCQAYVFISFLHCGEVITFYRFHVALVPQVLSCEADLHPNELEGDAMPKAMLVYAHTELKSNNLKEFGITHHLKGILLQPQCEGDVPELARSQLLRNLKDTPAGLKQTEKCLDARILHQLQRQYKEFAKPRTVHRVPPMGVAMALI